MKKSFLYLAAFAALFTACSKEIEQPTKEEPAKEAVQTYTLVAGIPETKTTLSGEVFSWSEGETIAVADGTTSPKTFTVSSDSDERANGVFTYTGDLSEDLRFAVTPASACSVPSASGNNVTITLPTNYTYVAGQTNAIMISTAPTLEGGNYKAHFTHAMALIKVSYTNVPIGTKYFKLTMDQNIAGGSVNIDASATPEIKVSDLITDPSKSVTVTLASAVSVANTSMDFYVPVPTGTYGSFKAELFDADDNALSTKNKSGLSLELGRADVFATPGITLPQQKVLNFDFTSEVSGWKQAKSQAAAGDFTYTINAVDYCFNLTKTVNGIYQSNPGGSKPLYLMINSGEILGLPVIAGYRLSKVVVANSESCSTSAQIGIISNVSTKAYVDDNKSTKTLTAQNKSYTFTLPDSYAGKRYYIYAADKNTQVYSIQLSYEESSNVFTPTSLTMNDISCSARTASSLTFNWDAVTNAIGYKISTDGGSTYGDTQPATSYTWSGLSSFSDNTIYVKAIADGVEYYDSSAKSATDKTTLAVPTAISWTAATKTVAWSDVNTSVGTYNTDYKYVYTLDNGETSSDASSSTTAVLSIDATKTAKVMAVCLIDIKYNSGWSDGTTCIIGDSAVTGEIYHENFGSPTGNTAIASFTGWEKGGSLGQTDVSYSYSGSTTTPIRNTSPSSGYTGASGNGSLYTAAGGALTVSNINITGTKFITFSCGTQATSANTAVTYQFNTQASASSLTATTNKTTGPGTWGLVSYTKLAVPSGATSVTLVITINSASRIDDLKIDATSE